VPKVAKDQGFASIVFLGCLAGPDVEAGEALQAAERRQKWNPYVALPVTGHSAFRLSSDSL